MIPPSVVACLFVSISSKNTNRIIVHKPKHAYGATRHEIPFSSYFFLCLSNTILPILMTIWGAGPAHDCYGVMMKVVAAGRQLAKFD